MTTDTRAPDDLTAAPPALTAGQRAVRPGDAVVLRDAHTDLLIYGLVLADAGCPPGLVFGRWHSAACPAGETGDIRRSRIVLRLRAGALARAASAGWPATLDALRTLYRPPACPRPCAAGGRT